MLNCHRLSLCYTLVKRGFYLRVDSNGLLPIIVKKRHMLLKSFYWDNLSLGSEVRQLRDTPCPSQRLCTSHIFIICDCFQSVYLSSGLAPNSELLRS